MKILVCLAAILVICQAGYPHLSLLRALGSEDSGVSLLNFPDYSEECPTNTLRECISCDEAKLCLPNGRPIAKVNCTSYSPSTPFCNPEDGLCTSSQPLGCGETSENSFQCPPQDGVYPDPEDCAKFHFCANSKATTVSCPKNNVYDHALGTCKLRRWPLDCVKFNCANKEGEDILYPKDDRIWATCAGGNAYIMGRCEDYESYDVNKKKCSRVCRIVENQPIKGVCDGYIRCAEIGSGKLEPVTFPCPPGQGFDNESKQCSSKISCSSSTEDEESSVLSRINNSGNDNSDNNVLNGDDDTNGNLVNGNNNSGNTNSEYIGSGNQDRPGFRINNSGNDNTSNNVTNGDDDTNGNLVNGNDNSNNVNTGSVGSGNQRRLASRIINNSGNNNNGNTVANGDDDVNGDLVNGNNNGNNENSGNVGSGNGGRLSSRIINSSGNTNSNQTIVNGNDNTNGSVINGNNNGNNENSWNVGSGNRGRLSSRIINSSGNSNSNQTIMNGNDNTNGSVINGNDNNNNKNSDNTGSANARDDNEDSSSSENSNELDPDASEGDNHSGESENPPNVIESFKDLIEWLKNKLGIKSSLEFEELSPIENSGDESTTVISTIAI